MLWHAEVLQMIGGAVGVDVVQGFDVIHGFEVIHGFDVVHCFNVVHDFCGTSEVGAGSVTT